MPLIWKCVPKLEMDQVEVGQDLENKALVKKEPNSTVQSISKQLAIQSAKPVSPLTLYDFIFDLSYMCEH